MSYDADESFKQREQFYDDTISTKDYEMKHLIIELIKDVRDMINEQDYDSHYDGDGVPQYYIKTEQVQALEKKLFDMLLDQYGMGKKKEGDNK